MNITYCDRVNCRKPVEDADKEIFFPLRLKNIVLCNRCWKEYMVMHAFFLNKSYPKDVGGVTNNGMRL